MKKPAIKPLFFTIILLLLNWANASAQNNDPIWEVKQEEESDASAIVRSLKGKKPDTLFIDQLLKASHIYWGLKDRTPKGIDSCLSLTTKVLKLSAELKYQKGRDEAIFMLAKIHLFRNDDASAERLVFHTVVEQQVRLYLVLADDYIKSLDTVRMSKALKYLLAARSLSRKIGSARIRNECEILFSKYYFSKGDLVAAKKTLLDNINVCHLAGNYAFEARNWSFMAHNSPENQDSYKFLIHCHEMAVKLYFKAGDEVKAGFELRDLAVVNTNHGYIEKAEKQFLQVLSVFGGVHKRVNRRTYYLLAEFYRFRSQYHRALRYGLQALHTPEEYDEKRMLVYRALGETYAVLGDVKKGLHYYQILLDHQLTNKSGLSYVSAYRMALIASDAGQANQALNTFSNYVRSNPPQNLSQEQLFTSLYGELYWKTGQYDKAEKQYKKMLALDPAVRMENGKNLHGHEITIAGTGALYLIGRYYGERGRYKDAKKYLERSLMDQEYFDAKQEMETYRLLFKADSAEGNYISAIEYFERHKAMNDSINSISRNNQISEINIRYQTEQKEKDIKLLKSKQGEQRSELIRAATIRNVILGSAVAFLLLAVLAFSAYRIKQRSNRTLNAQQLVINRKNQELEKLLSEKELFLKEKDWLLKEIHHRVKNNLQIIMSLLSTQSFYMQNDGAKEAIVQSENRVQSIALIHQKLYTGLDLASISMPDYVGDLVSHLGESFDTVSRNISFQLQIDPVNINLSQAVPVGLILNEAITNAIKYAFDKNGGQITVLLKRSENDIIEIAISDNGKGLPEDFDLRTGNSLGMDMMQGLTSQLKGDLKIMNQAGTAIVITFRAAANPGGNVDNRTKT
ncbi:hypothetical protein GCM10023149_16010 [Mucilaginibacter gynuensis]|uniref:histidine kinase n=1 Tax=Mucilaginibacter gynuensis TaxID=1302236 RepID=A0ABP8G5X3_9SPHI